MKVSLLQLDIAFGNPKANYAAAERAIRLAAQGQPDCILLPELWTTGYDLTRLDEMADPGGQAAAAFIGGLAKEYGINIIAGSTAWQRAEGVTNTMFAANREGVPALEYSKLHLFRLMDEHLYLQPGSSKGLFRLDGTPCAGVICYDIRFPEWIRAHMVSGAEVLFVSAEWPLPRLAHWRALLVSRAIENQCYVVACNRAGSDPANVFAGHSMIIDPWGEIVCEAGEGEEIISGELDLAKVREARRQIPVFTDRRPEMYK
ncbi:carbon-nitrogen family hydrolase [Paenibacillus durus]|uniref:Hydrolase n=1 Tax=Paenibacillus durus ATCC 35681 TaxID=1333534 RepID=A0A0F7CKA1_PAEDU|nr:carbon-nitrogen family hydrolase [Paenibacillus durus]AKG37301.1 hydrolase [Paenibacillus durus ATCC 35681]